MHACRGTQPTSDTGSIINFHNYLDYFVSAAQRFDSVYVSRRVTAVHAAHVSAIAHTTMTICRRVRMRTPTYVCHDLIIHALQLIGCACMQALSIKEEAGLAVAHGAC